MLFAAATNPMPSALSSRATRLEDSVALISISRRKASNSVRRIEMSPGSGCAAIPHLLVESLDICHVAVEVEFLCTPQPTVDQRLAKRCVLQHTLGRRGQRPRIIGRDSQSADAVHH